MDFYKKLYLKEIESKTLYYSCPTCKQEYKKESSLYVRRVEDLLLSIQKQKDLSLSFPSNSVNWQRAYFALADNLEKQLKVFLDWADHLKI